MSLLINALTNKSKVCASALTGITLAVSMSTQSSLAQMRSDPSLRPPITTNRSSNQGASSTTPPSITSPTIPPITTPAHGTPNLQDLQIPSGQDTQAPPATPQPSPQTSAEKQDVTNTASSPVQAGSPAGKLLRLSVAFNESFMTNPRTGAVRAQLGINKAAYYDATVMQNPSLVRDQGYLAEQSRRFGSTHTYEPPWKIVFRMLAAKELFKEGKLEIMNTLWQFRNDVRRAYTDVVTSQETYQTLSDLADLTRQLLEVTQKRVTAGAVPALDELKARLALSQAEIERTRGHMNIQKAKQHLNVMLARPVSQAVEIPRLPIFKLRAEKSDMLPDFTQPVPPLSSYIEQALENRLELRIAKQQLKVSEAQLRTAYGNIIPNPSFGAGSSTAGNPPTGPKLRAFYVNMNIEMPTFNYNQGEIARLKATINQWRLQFQANKNIVTDDVTKAYNDLIIARERIRQYQDHTLAESEEVARLARRSYEVGQSDIASALLALQANVITRSQYIDAVTEYAQAVTNLEQAVGEPLQ